MLFIAMLNKDLSKTLKVMNKATNEWTMKAARGECAWVCSDCGCSFPSGMPDTCEYDDQRCTDIIQRDKKDALTTEKSHENS